MPQNPNAFFYLKLEADGYMTSEYVFGAPLIGAPSDMFPLGETTMFTVPEGLPPMVGEAGSVYPIPVVRGDPIAMVQTAQLDTFFSEFGQGEQRNPDRGLLALRMIDCDDKRAPNVILEMGDDIEGGFGFTVLTNNVPAKSVDPMRAGPTVIGDSGGAGFANLPPRIYRPVGVLEDGRTYGGQVGFRVRQNVFTNGDLRPHTAYAR